MYADVSGGNGMTDIDREIIKALANNNLNTTKSAKALFMGRRTLYRHINKIHKLTGLNPLNFWDLVKLLKM